MNKNDCDCCIWHDSWTWACCNGKSKHRADFVNCGCEKKKIGGNKMEIKVVLDENVKMPTKAHETDAGFDLYAPADFVVSPAMHGEAGTAVIDTGVHMQIPEGYVGFLKSKSGLNVKHGITSEGVIDSGYTGSIVVKLYNYSAEEYRISAGDKISQIVVLPIPEVELTQVDKLEKTERGNGGFGSSGK